MKIRIWNLFGILVSCDLVIPGGQKGFSQLVLIALLAVGIVTGTVLVQNRTNFLPKAAEQEGLHPSAGATKNCDNEENKEACIAGNNRICAADTVTFCDNRSGSPRAIRKSGGYYDPSDPNTDPASGCVFDYREVSGKNSECGKAESKSGDVVYTTVDEAKKLDSERAQQSAGSGQASSGTNDSQTTACTPAATTAYNDAKVANNLVRFYAILNGAGGLCVPADLGVPEKDEIVVNGVDGRLLMCSDKESNLHWMIVDAANKKLIPVPESQKEPPNRDTLEVGFKNLSAARQKAGL